MKPPLHETGEKRFIGGGDRLPELMGAVEVNYAMRGRRQGLLPGCAKRQREVFSRGLNLGDSKLRHFSEFAIQFVCLKW